MIYFFSKITADHWAPKNNLQKEAKQVARDMDCRIISADQILSFTVLFFDSIDKLNAKYNRCKPLHLSKWDRVQTDKVIQFNISEVFSLCLYQAKNEPGQNDCFSNSKHF